MTGQYRPAAAFLISALAFACACPASSAAAFVTDPAEPLFRALSRPAEYDQSTFGAGPLENPGRTIFVRPGGDPGADGSSPEKATTLRQAFLSAGPGDTVLLGGGTYYDHPLPDVPGGEPGRPVRIFAAPRERVIICPSLRVGPFRPTDGLEHVYEAEAVKPRDIENYTATWEADSLRVLEPAASLDQVAELPGTFIFDEDNDLVFVRFHESAGRPGEGRHIYVLRRHRGMTVRDASHVHIRGLWFKHGPFWGLGLFGRNITVEDCVFYGNWGCGLYFSASDSLVRNNYGFANEERGTIQFRGSGPSSNNLVIGNRADASPPSWRSGRGTQHWAINAYGYGGRDIHIVHNVMDGGLGFRWKSPVPGVFQGNVLSGRLYFEGGPGLGEEGGRLVHRANTFLGGVRWALLEPGPGGWGGDWYGAEGREAMAFFGNLAIERGREEIEEARFADPAYLDARLQSNSPLRGRGPGGTDPGAFPHGAGRVFFVGPGGSDGNHGGSVEEAFATLGKATSALGPGDTLYIVAGNYAERLEIGASGTEKTPVLVRARGRERVTLPGIEITGDRVTVEGIEVSGATGDGISVLGREVTLKHCLVRAAAGAAVSVEGAGFLMNQCTLTGSAGAGLRLGPGATDATARNSIIAFNRGGQLVADPAARAGYRGFNNCHYRGPFPAGETPEFLPGETGSIFADPLFADPAAGDFRVLRESPCVYLGEFAPPAGALGVRPEAVSIKGVETRTARDTAAIIAWRTPVDDSTGLVQYRKAGETRWRSTPRSTIGTRHAAALTDLEPETEYEARVLADGRLASRAFSAPLRFRTAGEAAAPAVYHVSPAGSDENDGLSPGTAWRTLRRACAQVLPGDTVHIAPGRYGDPIVPLAGGLPGRRITFRGPGDGRAIIDSGQVQVPLVDLERRGHVTIEGLTLLSDIPAGHPPPAVRIVHSDGVEILDCEIRRTGGRSRLEGIQAVSSRGLRVEGNLIVGKRYAIALWHCDDPDIRHNTMARKSVYMLRMSGVRRLGFVGNLLYEDRSFRNAFLLARPGRDIEGNQDVFTVAEMNRNLYYTTDPALHIGANDRTGESGEDLAAWRRLTGWDAESLEADPLFVDLENGDFRLSPESPARGAGPGGRNIGAF